MSYDDDQFDLFERTHTHSPGLETETLAAAKTLLSVASMRNRIMQELSEAGEWGLTPDEYAKRHESLINTVRRRFTDLWKDGLIRHHPDGRTRLNSDLNECIVWVTGCDPGASGMTESRIARLRAQLREHGIQPCC
jgi:hypothetical protein